MPTTFLTVQIPQAPPTDNHLYRTGFHGKRILSEEGKGYINLVRQCVADAWVAAGMPKLPQDKELGIYIAVRLPHVYTTTKKAVSRFVTIDVQNRGKVILDAVSAALGFNDAHHFDVHFTKHEGESAAYIRLEILDGPPKWPGA